MRRRAFISIISVQLGFPRIEYRPHYTLQPMKAVPSVLRYLGKCTAGFSSNYVHTLLNSATNEVAPSVAR